MRKPRGAMGTALVLAALASAVWFPQGAQAGTKAQGSNPSSWFRAHSPWNIGGAAAPVAAPSSRSTIECVTPPSSAENITLDCRNEYALPTRETNIAVDPTDPAHLVVAAIDGRDGNQTIEFSTSFDAGKTWTIGDIPHQSGRQNFDPWVSFDVNRRAVVLIFDSFAVPGGCPGRQQSATSVDGGLHWSPPVTILAGRCGSNDLEFFEGKVATDNDPASPYYGRTWLTGLLIRCRNDTCTFPVGESHSDDAGATWTRPRAISASNEEYCTTGEFGGNPPRCDNDFPPTPAVFGSNGSVYVAFPNIQHEAAWEPNEFEDQMMLVSTTDGGQTWSPPAHVVDLEDGFGYLGYGGDFDSSAGFYGDRFTGLDLCPNCATAYNTLAMTSDGKLYLTFDDNRNGLHDAEHPVSNNDVFVMTSTDGGSTWSGPDVVDDAPGDQFKPSIAVNRVTGELGILFYDRSDDPEGKTAEVTLATGLPNSFELSRISTAPSHLSDDLSFTQTLPDCHRCVFHIGEYIGIAYGSDGAVNMTWTDLRHFATTPDGRRGYTMNVVYAREEKDRG
jgi:hypothetical protein